MCYPNRRLITIKEASFKRYVGTSYAKSLLIFSKNRRSKTLFESSLPEYKAKYR